MNSLKRAFLCTGMALTGLLLAATNSAAQDQQEVLEWSEFRQLVLTRHPLAIRADQFQDLAEAGLLQARGGFDPKSFVDLNGKSFAKSNYFQYSEAGIKIPTYLGLELKGAYNLASGQYLNPESRLPQDGQAQLGIRWSLGQGLLMDDRRAELKTGRIGIQFGAAERRQALNNLLLEGAKTYWDWVAAWNTVQVYEAALRQAEIRLDGLVESFIQGDKPAIDTLETYIQLQNRRIDLNFAQVELRNATVELANFLWTTDNTPFPPEQISPAPSLQVTADQLPVFDDAALRESVDQAMSSAPDLLLYNAKLQQLEVERRLKLEKRKPVLDLEYNILGSGWTFFPSSGLNGAELLANDIKWGLNFSYPLPNRKARGDYRMTQLKISQTTLAYRQKQLETAAKVQQYVNEINNLKEQIDLYRQITANYRTLLDAENEKFRFGESSIFLINSREQAWLNAQIKLMKMISTFRKTEAGLDWSIGRLAD